MYLICQLYLRHRMLHSLCIAPLGSKRVARGSSSTRRFRKRMRQQLLWPRSAQLLITKSRFESGVDGWNMLPSASNRLLGPGNGCSCSVFKAVLERCNTKRSLRHTAMQAVQENFGCMSWPHEPIQLKQDSKEFHATIHTHMTFCFLGDL